MSDLQQLLERTSRTFALAIPLLPEPTRVDVTIAYLVFRIADTIEDADYLSISERTTALNEFAALLEKPNSDSARDFSARWASRKITDSSWHQQLVADTPFVFAELGRRNESVQESIHVHARRTTSGMASFVANTSQHLTSLPELRSYCYCVAGIVGELLTDIFSRRIPAFTVSSDVQRHAKAFGEGLQLVNVLKDSKEDLRCGRMFIPESIERETLFTLARKDLKQATRYVACLREANADSGYVSFAKLPLELAFATLDHVERNGPGSKISRSEVLKIETDIRSQSRASGGSQVREFELRGEGQYVGRDV